MDPNSRKNDDCYFYYYSTCLKGDNCLFRHEENALGCETVCQFWKEGKCFNERCNFRHMELKKNRKVIPCYWETQPGGCRKPHCPFRHQKDKPPDKPKDGTVGGSNMGMPGGVLNVPGNTANRNPSTDGGVPGPTVVRSDLNYAANPVDPIVVKFEEESDNESVPSSPIKSSLSPSSRRQSPSLPLLKVKTLEEIRLELVQKQSAAYYNFDNNFMEPLSRRVTILPKDDYFEDGRKKRLYADCKVLTLDEIRKNRQKRFASTMDSNNSDDEYDPADVDSVYSFPFKGSGEQYVQLKNADRRNQGSYVLPDSTSNASSCSDVKDFSTNDDGNNSRLGKFCELDDYNVSNDTCVNMNSKADNNSRLEVHDVVETQPHHKQRPIKLRRFIKKPFDETNSNKSKRKLKRAILSSADDNPDGDISSSRDSLKRTKLNTETNVVCSTSVVNNGVVNNESIDSNYVDNSSNPSEKMELSLPCSPVESNYMDTVDILKDIDDLLNT